MKRFIPLMLVLIGFASCTTRKTESTEVRDSLKADSAALAIVPAPATLAFNHVIGYSVRNTVSLIDTVNFILLANQEEVDKKFALDKSLPERIKPDFTINYIVAVVCSPSMLATTITLDKVEVGENDINVYLNIKRGEKQSVTSKPAQIFAIERRDGYNTMQFFVNGQKSQVHMLNPIE